MRRLSSLLFAIAIVSLHLSELSAQWTSSSLPLLGRNKASNGGGAIQYSDGVVWAAHQLLLRSDDTGLTWRTVSTPFMFPDEYITSIHFVNRNVGLVTSHSNVGYTTDGGRSWAAFTALAAQSGLVSNDAKTLIVVDQKKNAVLISTDSGSTWATTSVPSFPTDVMQSRDGDLFVLTGYDPSSRLMHSLNGGKTFDTLDVGFFGDSWSLAQDSCDGMFAVNEDYWAQNDVMCHIYCSSDRGASWTTSFSAPIPELSGSICVAPAAAYAQTVRDGVLETTDKGTTWHFLAGPSENVDSRCICTVEGKYVIASDSTGYLWRYKTAVAPPTTGPPIVQPVALFERDSISACDSVERSILLIATPCSGTRLLSADIVGADKAHYKIRGSIPSILYGSDSIHILFKAGTVRDYHATLVLTFDGDSVHHIVLGGFGSSLVGALSYSPKSLFQGTQISSCDTAQVRVCHISDGSCIHRHVIFQGITGPHAQDYALQRSLGDTIAVLDSVLISLYPKQVGNSTATYEIVLDDSTRISIPLEGEGIEAKSYAYFTVQKLFDQDTLTLCTSPIVRDIALEDSGCHVTSVDSAWIEGRDARTYQIVQGFPSSLSGHDTARIQFTCSGIGDFLATFKARLSDGTVLQLPLSAYGASPIFHSIKPIYNDTIGTDIQIPITFNMSKVPWDLAVRVRFDTAMLEYRGTYTADNTNVGKLLRPGYIEVHLPKNTYVDPAHVLATTHFDFYPIKDSCGALLIDSFTIGDGHCSLIATHLFDTVCSTLTENCQSPYITQLMRWPPLEVRIQPNPAEATVLIHSDRDIDDAEITVTDALGQICLQTRAALSAGQPYPLAVESLPAGLYGLHVRSGPQSVRMSLMHLK